MATQIPSSSSSLKIIIGSSSNTSSSEESSASDVTSTTNVTIDDLSSAEQRTSIASSICQVLTIGATDSNMEDVLPTYVLQPKEISKNIDLMKTVAMLMESKLQQPLKGSDSEKMRDLYSDIQRFPEAYQKFTSIIHQIQYLNVTTNWDIPKESEDGKTGIISKLLQSQRFNSESEQDVRKRLLLNLVNDVMRVFSRYQAIQVSLEERLKNFNDFIVKKSIQQYRSSATDSIASPTVVAPADYSDEDDPQQPLLNRTGVGSGGGASDRKVFVNFLEKLEVLAEILRKGRRQATEVQDSIEVLRDLINWDHKQIISSSHTCNSNETNQQASSGALPEIVVHQQSNSNTESCCRNDRASREQNRKAWIITAIVITILALLLITTAALSFLKFNY